MAVNSTIAVYATNGNRTPVVPMRELMEKCINLRTLVLFALPRPLLAAAQADITKWLEAGARIHNIAAQFPLAETAQAHLAVEKGDKEMVQLLVSKGADVNTRDRNKRTALLRAQQVGRLDLEQILRAAGAVAPTDSANKWP